MEEIIKDSTRDPSNFPDFKDWVFENYNEEFEEIIAGNFPGEETIYKEVILNGVLVKNYFCPEDSCEEKVLEVLSSLGSQLFLQEA